jgi:hypothetical protein
VKEQRLTFEAPASSSASPAFCAPGRPGAHSLLFPRYHQHQHQRRRQHQHPPGPPPVHIGAPLHVVCPVPFNPAGRRFLLSLRGLSLDRACSYGVTRGLWASGVFCRGLAQRHVRASANVFSLRADTGGFFLFLSLSLSFRCFLSFFFGAISLSLSSALSPPRPALCGYVAAVGGQRANDVYERNVNGISVA